MTISLMLFVLRVTSSSSTLLSGGTSELSIMDVDRF
jgi:hypothetical protein